MNAFLCTCMFWWLCEYVLSSAAQDGWNDPPAVRAGQRKKKVFICKMLILINGKQYNESRHLCVCCTAARELHSTCSDHRTGDGLPYGGSCAAGPSSGAARSPSGAQHTGQRSSCSVHQMCLCGLSAWFARVCSSLYSSFPPSEWSRRKYLPNTWSSRPPSAAWCSAVSWPPQTR